MLCPVLNSEGVQHFQGFVITLIWMSVVKFSTHSFNSVFWFWSVSLDKQVFPLPKGIHSFICTVSVSDVHEKVQCGWWEVWQHLFYSHCSVRCLLTAGTSCWCGFDGVNEEFVVPGCNEASQLQLQWRALQGLIPLHSNYMEAHCGCGC
jgi:hypothetical protein